MNYNVNEDKTESATPHKIKQFKKHGEIPYLFDLNSFFILSFFFVFLYINKKFIFFFLLKLFIVNLTFDHKIVNYTKLCDLIALSNFKNFIFLFLILFIGMLLILIFSPFILQGDFIRMKFFKIKTDSLHIINNLKKKFFFSVMIDFFCSMLKIMTIIIFSIFFIWTNRLSVNQFFFDSLLNDICISFNWFNKYILFIMVIIGIIAIIDTSIKYIQYCYKLKMTIQEVKDETKELEGNPLIKQRVYALMRYSSKKSSIYSVIQSNVIIFNAKNCAVAIHYNMKIMSSPQVLFKGLGDLSVQIIQIAQKSNIPIFISDSIAKYLYYNSLIGHDIPIILYPSIAKILAWAHQLERWKKYGGTYPPTPIIFFH
ncbi:EscU/YscU/HrcU family type III secretion system export apparatus switch protein [Buchnera aphidicola]|uniref:Flagellar biosynthetic protein FlhB n=1 Tax=Buchnera aphidicola (Cinara cf. splendens/pseudotsugae 3390) TaxID=2518980 RepID=A0A451CX92_9GAMM|nr:EscU/YscU/HrcU family type III secretion system export apparatus switch protein [Buchnera aphidicola]VFP77733.1 Flagellar biosynthetic protein FlhB [Buchnera aphidicola (Cinara cf. splendens/pseudotsugae 3390)]